LEEQDLFKLFFSIRGILSLIGMGLLLIQNKIISDQKKKISIYEENISIIEPLLKAVIERPDTPQDIKELALETIKQIKATGE